MGVFVVVVGEEGEGGLVEVEDAWREWRMYLAESLSISCWSSDTRRSFKRSPRMGRQTDQLLDFLDALSLVRDDRLLPEGCQRLFADITTGHNNEGIWDSLYMNSEATFAASSRLGIWTFIVLTTRSDTLDSEMVVGPSLSSAFK
jgi:hypothetical protein